MMTMQVLRDAKWILRSSNDESARRSGTEEEEEEENRGLLIKMFWYSLRIRDV